MPVTTARTLNACKDVEKLDHTCTSVENVKMKNSYSAKQFFIKVNMRTPIT